MGKRQRPRRKPWLVVIGQENDSTARVASRWPTLGLACFEAVRLAGANIVAVQRERTAQAARA